MPPPPKTRIFRKVSLERLASPEQLDVMLKVTNPMGWLALGALGLLLAAALLWGFFGSIPTKIPGRGILVRGSGMREVFAPRLGLVREMLVKVGDKIEPMQPVARMAYGDLESSMRATRAVLDAVRKEPDTLPGHVERLQKAENDLTTLQVQYDAQTTVLSPFAGTVADVLANRWDLVQAGTHLLYVEPTDAQMEALIYLSPNDGGRVAPGMAVQVVPVTVKPESYGYMLGDIDKVAKFPSSMADLRRRFDNEQLVQQLAAGQAPILVNVRLRRDPTTHSTFAWSSGVGPPYPVTMGTICSASVVIREQRPIELIIPRAAASAGGLGDLATVALQP